eukprot:2173_1
MFTMTDPLLKKMDNLVDLINNAIESNMETKEEKQMIEPTTPNAKYLDNKWIINRKQQLEILESNGYNYRADKDVNNNIERPIGHTTHNLFLKDKKSNERFLITHHQSHKMNYKTMAKKLKQKGFKIKELRMDSQKNREENLQKYFGFTKGCITSLSLLNLKNYDKKNGVKWIVDSSLTKSNDKLAICAGCADAIDHTQHHVIDISMLKLLELVQKIGVEPVLIDC